MPIDWETPYPLKLGHSLNDPILCFAASCDDLKTVKCQSIEKRRILWNAGSSDLQIDREMMPITWFAASSHLPHPPIFRLTVKYQSTEKRQIPWNVASFDLAFQSMERYRGRSVSKDGAFLGWLAITVDLQIRGCGIKNNSRGMQNTATSRIKQADN